MHLKIISAKPLKFYKNQWGSDCNFVTNQLLSIDFKLYFSNNNQILVS